jgi:hypothetical protein
MKPVLKITGALGGLIALLAVVTRTSGPTLTILAILALVTVATVVGALCWTITDTPRTQRLTQLIHATRRALPEPRSAVEGGE